MDYPKGKTMQLPAGSLSMYVPGQGNVTSRRQGTPKPNAASECADSMRVLIPGVEVGPATYKKN